MSEAEQHIKTIRLVDLGRDSGFKLTREEKKHLRDCEECRAVVEVFARQFSRQKLQDKEKAA